MKLYRILLLVVFVMICMPGLAPAQLDEKWFNDREIKRPYKVDGVTRLKMVQAIYVIQELQLTPEQQTKIKETVHELVLKKYAEESKLAFQKTAKNIPKTPQYQGSENGFKLDKDQLDSTPDFSDYDKTNEQKLEMINEFIKKEREVLGTILDEEQFQRLEEIYLQLKGAEALVEEPIAEQLELTGEQSLKIIDVCETLKADEGKEVRQLNLTKTTPEIRAVEKKIAKLKHEAQRDIYKILTQKQARKLKTLRGKSFANLAKLKQKVWGDRLLW
ncbi:MAG: hypothetical protein R3C11_16985 [Planctomycetaceae bacterium]